MSEIKLLQPQAGNWILPMLECAGCAESERDDVLVLMFRAVAEQDDGVMTLTLRVPIPKTDASALLGRFLDLQEMGRLAAPAPVAASSEIALDA